MLIPFMLFGLVLGGAIYLALRVYARSDASRLVTAVSATTLALAVLGVILLVLRARVGLLLVAVAGGLYVIFYLHGWWLQRLGGASPDGKPLSPIITQFLNIVRDANTGRLYGTVLAGRHRGRRLTELSLDQLLEVREECRRDDADAALLIEAYLDQAHGAQWRAKAGGARAGMTRAEAYEILGLQEGASEADVRDAHHRLSGKLQGGQGGSDYLAGKIDQARDVLLNA